MELSDYARSKKRWIAPLVAVPLLAGGVTAALLAEEPPQYTATVQVQVPGEMATADSRIGLYAANLGQAVLVGGLAPDVAQRTGVPLEDLAATTVTRVQKSDQLDLVVTSSAAPDRTLDAAKQMTQGGMLRLLGPNAADPQQAVRSASEELGSAQADLYGYQQQIGYAPAVGGGSDANQSADTAALGALPPDQRQGINERQARTEAAGARLVEAQKSLVTTQSSVDAVKNGSAIVAAAVGPEPTLRPILEGAGVAGVVGLLAVLGLMIVPDLFRRQHGRPETTDADHGSGDQREPDPSDATDARTVTASAAHRPTPGPRSSQENLVGSDAIASDAVGDGGSVTERLPVTTRS